MKDKLLLIAEAILDETYRFTRETLAEVSEIQHAAKCMDMDLSVEQAELIQKTCLAWLDKETKTSDDYYQDVERVLKSDDVKTDIVIIAAKTIPYAENLLHLCDRLNMTEKLASDAGVKLTDHVDTSSLPTFGGVEPSDTIEIWSWDSSNLLRFDSTDGWYLSRREDSEYIEVLADGIFQQARSGGADWAVTTWILGNNHFLCDDENGHHTIVYRDDETELDGVPREVRKMTNTECIDWLLAGADLSELIKDGGKS